MVVLSPLLVVVVCGIRQSVVLTFPNRLAVGINEFVRRQFAAQFAMPSSIHWAAAKIELFTRRGYKIHIEAGTCI